MFQSQSLSLIHLARPQQAGSGRPPLLLLLHGVGSNEHDLFSIAPLLDPRLLILSLQAPLTLQPGSYAWFEVVFMEGGNHLGDAEQAEASRQLLIRFIPEAVQAYGADPQRVYLLGFSQGAIMSASVLLSRPDLVAGAALLSGRIPAELRSVLAEPAALAGKPVLLQHGIYDSVLPLFHGRAARDLLSELPVTLSYREYPMAHEITPESLTDLTTWLRERLED